ncbi:MAG: VOC family protein [Planctomycetes bacterium]|nr:VOC family protein [Planctomycetota bacterium]
MLIQSLDDLNEFVKKRSTEVRLDVQGPQYFEWGYVMPPNITYWSGDRRVHFYFEGDLGRIYVKVEASEMGPPRRVVLGRIQETEEAFQILYMFLRKRCPFEKLPTEEWLPDAATHDSDIPHPPDKDKAEGQAQPSAPPQRESKGGVASPAPAVRPEVRISPVGSVPAPAPRPVPAPAAAGLAAIGGFVLYSNDAAATARWYRDVLGVPLQENGGQYGGRLGSAQIIIQSSETPLAAGARGLMLSFVVTNFDAFVAGMSQKGADVLGMDESKQGKFAYTRDPEGNPIEIWGPPGS